MSERVELGSCPACGGPAQFIEGGVVRYVDLGDAGCESYLKESETPAQCIARNRADLASTIGLLAEATGRIEKLEAEVARLEEERDDLCAALSGQTDRAVVAEAKLRAVKELVLYGEGDHLICKQVDGGKLYEIIKEARG